MTTTLRLLMLALGGLLAGCGGEADGPGEARVLGEIAVDLRVGGSVVRGREALVGNLVTDALREALPEAQVALVNGGALRVDPEVHPEHAFPAGPFDEADLAELLPFDDDASNDVVLVTVTGAGLESVLERSVSALNGPEPEPGSVEELKGWFLQVSGLRFVADTSRQRQVYNASTGEVTTEGERVVEAHVGEAALDPAASYRIATRAFIADGRDGHTAFSQGADRVELRESCARYLARYLEAHSPVTPVLEGRITVR